jgi:hypothetical protein
VTLALAIAALVVSAVTVIAVARQVTEAKKSNTLPTAIDLFREYRSIEMEQARRLLADQLPRLDTTGGCRAYPKTWPSPPRKSAITSTTSVFWSHVDSSIQSLRPGSSARTS